MIGEYLLNDIFHKYFRKKTNKVINYLCNYHRKILTQNFKNIKSNFHNLQDDNLINILSGCSLLSMRKK